MTGFIRLPSDLTIYQVAELKPVLLKALHEYEHKSIPIELELSAVNECDGAGIQLLLALTNSAAKLGATVALHSVPHNVAKLLDQLQISSRFIIDTQVTR